MENKVKEGDFIELEYTGKLKELDAVFDSTNADIAKKEGIFDPKMVYGPIEICVGEGQLLRGLDKAVTGLEIGKEHTIELTPENAFGKKDGKLMKLVPTSAFKKQGVNPVPQLQVNIDGAVGTIRTVSGGRTVVDFNHPFAGKDVVYRINIKRLITDDKEKVITLLTLALNQKKESIGVMFEGEKIKVELKADFPAEFLNLLKERVLKHLTKYKEVEFITPKPKTPQQTAGHDEQQSKSPEKQEKKEGENQKKTGTD